jgi:nitrate/nitrite transporter NarK
MRDREYLDSAWSQENAELEPTTFRPYFKSLVTRETLALCCTQFFVLSGQLGYLFWLPSAIGHAGHFSNFSIGLLLTIPYLIGGIALVVNSWLSDRSGERRRHVTIPLILGGILLLAGVLISKRSPPFAFVLITFASIGAFGPLGPFWALPTELFSKRMAGSVTGMVNSVGHLGGYFGPFLVGYLNRRTGDFVAGFIVLAGIMLLASVCPFLLPAGQRLSPLEKRTTGAVATVD